MLALDARQFLFWQREASRAAAARLYEAALAASAPHMKDDQRARLLQDLGERMRTPEERTARQLKAWEDLRRKFPARKGR